LAQRLRRLVHLHLVLLRSVLPPSVL